ncbi:GNAT family N-acetyltransferase [Nonomuraea endophytica]|uniref:Ribosomal protein S18 acetylase RimI-like enzyme n=1 Tax=Nonomuraea endophytica TaxID=714136 RepID=A0A7W8EJ26_9ACTN|nr:GNAT family N-acetyltransferase [Nonomuraea endophytica]MBB5080277.1 ribosomal protein S18 acetylase RimI-like enzyme [Nonomuraea endophytica]
MNRILRDYARADEPSWLRCRVLAFLSTAYYDDVAPAKPAIAAPGFELVAVDRQATVLGLMDVAVDGELATIETVAVHPDHQHAGIGRALLEQALTRVRTMPTVTTLDAWTRDDPDALRWYRAMGFRESDHYLHVYASHYAKAERTQTDEPAHTSEPERALTGARPGLHPVSVFLHASLNEEERLRREFARVHVCRRFSMTL